MKDKDFPYRRDAFNQYGDVMEQHHQTSRLKKTDIVSGLTAVPALPEKISRVIDRLNEFEHERQKTGVRVFYSFPPIPQEFFERHGSVIEEIATELERRLQFPILDSPKEMTFPLEYFFDSAYHLTAEGSVRRTNLLINKLMEKGINRAPGVSNHDP
jgi:hypothetical protein